MQGWMFEYTPEFWKPPQIQALLSGYDKGRILILDLAAEQHPVWSQTRSSAETGGEAFYGLQPFIFSTVFDYGGRSGKGVKVLMEQFK
jgi:alpha-N-acetylglucosaminidase